MTEKSSNGAGGTSAGDPPKTNGNNNTADPASTETTAFNGENSDSRFGGLAAQVEASIRSSIGQNIASKGAFSADKFRVTAAQLSQLSNERTRQALITVLEQGVHKEASSSKGDDEEAPSSRRQLQTQLEQLIADMKQDIGKEYKEHSEEQAKADTNADIGANILTTFLLQSSPEVGIHASEMEARRDVFGTNAIAAKELDGFCKLCWEAVQDFVLIMLIVLGVISIVVETTIGLEDGETCGPCWIEGAAILVSVCIVVFVTAGIDYAKQFAFIRLTKSLHDTNTKAVIRDGKQVSITDDDIVVGDILSVNSHNLASIPADCVLLGPAADLKMDESSLTGESKAILKKPGDIILSGTTAIQGSGKMVVIAVGINSVAGKIKARVYESQDHEDDLDGEDENSPLFVKLELIAKQIGIAGTVAAVVAFVASCVIGLAIQGDELSHMVEYLIVSITVLAVAVPEGLPLAVTLALAFSSNKMMAEQNLVKHLDACETMGCATTICTDKTGK
jgi:P-type Ca2+ transporter type 2B